MPTISDRLSQADNGEQRQSSKQSLRRTVAAGMPPSRATTPRPRLAQLPPVTGVDVTATRSNRIARLVTGSHALGTTSRPPRRRSVSPRRSAFKITTRHHAARRSEVISFLPRLLLLPLSFHPILEKNVSTR